MAIQSPFGNYADLSSYRNLVDAQKLQQLQQGGALGQLLGNVEAGAQQGNTLANLGDIIQQQNQLRNDQALQSTYKTQLLNEALQNALDPNRQLAQQVNAKIALARLNPESGYVQSPDVLGTLGNQAIQTPATITPEQNAAITQGGLAPESLNLPTAGAPIVPILNVGNKLTGTSFDPNIKAAAEESQLQQDIKKATEVAKARAAAAPVGYTTFTDNLGNVSYIPKAPGRGEVTPLLDAQGNQMKAKLPRGGAREIGLGSFTTKQAGDIQNRAIDQYDLDPNDFTSLTELKQKVRDLDRQTGGLSPDRLKAYTYLDKQISLDPVIKAKRVTDAKINELNSLLNRWDNLPEDERKANLDQAIQDINVNIISARAPTISQIRSSKDYAPASQKLKALVDRYISGRGGIYDKAAVQEIEDNIKAIKSGGDEAATNQINNVFGNEIIRSGFDPKEFTGEKKVTNQNLPVTSPVSTPVINPNAPAPIKIGRFTVTAE